MGNADRAAASSRFIYIACPWNGPNGGGMYKVADYLIQAQAEHPPAHAAQLRSLDTRGAGSAASSIWLLVVAIAKLARGRIAGNLAGVHVNMAERLSLFRKSMIVIACRALGIPVVLHLHAQMKGFYRSLPGFLQAAVRWVFSLPSTVVVIGAASRRFVMEELGVPAGRIDIVFNGVPGPSHAPAPRPPREKHHVLFVGRLTEIKGAKDLLHALAKPGFDREHLQVTLAGSGDIDGFRAMAQRLGIDDFVRFAGWCEQPEITRLLEDADVLVLPSHDEVLPLVILEALANRVTVVCTPVGELNDVLTDGVDALLVPVADPDALAATLQKLARDPELAGSIAGNGRALYDRQFSVARFFMSVGRIHQRHFGTCAQLPQPAPAREAA